MADLHSALHNLRAKAVATEAAKAAPRAPLIEIFWSIQGEGRFVGVPMAFLRVATCPLRCTYCDTPHSYEAPPTFPVKTALRELREPNPSNSERAADLVKMVTTQSGQAPKVPRLSITGGEPLVFPDFVKELGRKVRAHGFRAHLETAAHDPKALQQCIEQVDHLSADYKLPETIGGQSYAAQHVQCCQIAIQRGASVDVKIVLNQRTTDAGLEKAFADLQVVREKILLVLQPATPMQQDRGPENVDLQRWVALTARAGFDLRVLPQVHRALRVP
ncbi:MAG: 7-carboxy-7-deazaguanine synthase QueE [Planctomycetes bacterium]|nr:7-carboxy-7-deazaguanine synthase QueE [Planctomycetota bacterium]